MENELIETGSLMIYQNEKGDTKMMFFFKMEMYG